MVRNIIISTLLILTLSCNDEFDITYNPVESELSVFEEEFFILINEYRESIGIGSVETDELVRGLAYDHCKYMILNGEISHNNFNLRVVKLGEYNINKVGEIVAFGYGTSKGLLNGYLNSPEHRKIIERGEYTHVGIKSVKDKDGRYYNVAIFVKI
jgi:uncharacterized protein YkwD